MGPGHQGQGAAPAGADFSGPPTRAARGVFARRKRPRRENRQKGPRPPREGGPPPPAPPSPPRRPGRPGGGPDVVDVPEADVGEDEPAADVPPADDGEPVTQIVAAE